MDPGIKSDAVDTVKQGDTDQAPKTEQAPELESKPSHTVQGREALDYDSLLDASQFLDTLFNPFFGVIIERAAYTGRAAALNFTNLSKQVSTSLLKA